MDLELRVKLSGPTNNVAGYVRLANALLEECATNPRFKEFTENNESVWVRIEGLEPIRLQGHFMNSVRNNRINPAATYLNLAKDFKKMTEPAR